MGFFTKNPLSHAAPLVFTLSITLLSSAAAQTQTPEFRLLELESQLSAHPPDPSLPEGRERLFALAETRFDNRLASAAEPFERLERPAIADAIDWLSFVYRIQAGPAGEKTAALERRLRDALSARGFFMVFDAKRSWRWNSPNGHRFEFRESVDKLEIDRDDTHFFSLQLD